MFEDLDSTQKVKLAILAARRTTKGRSFLLWSQKWLSGEDRTEHSAFAQAKGRNATAWAGKAAGFLGQKKSCPENGQAFDIAIFHVLIYLHDLIEEEAFSFPWQELHEQAKQPECLDLGIIVSTLERSLHRLSTALAANPYLTCPDTLLRSFQVFLAEEKLLTTTSQFENISPVRKTK